jgi:hypothetical protein
LQSISYRFWPPRRVYSGFEGVTVAAVMKDAGLTHGALLPLVCFQVWEPKPREAQQNSDTAVR